VTLDVDGLRQLGLGLNVDLRLGCDAMTSSVTVVARSDRGMSWYLRRGRGTCAAQAEVSAPYFDPEDAYARDQRQRDLSSLKRESRPSEECWGRDRD
jgi:hypothetical protein